MAWWTALTVGIVFFWDGFEFSVDGWGLCFDWRCDLGGLWGGL